MSNHPVHVYIPFDGVTDAVKQGIVDKLNKPNERFGFEEPPISIAPALDAAEAPASTIPDHSGVEFKDALEKELKYGQESGRGTAFFIWAEGSALQVSDPTVRVIHAWPPDNQGDAPKVEEICAELDVVAHIVNCVESGNQSFDECQDWAGADGIVRAQ
ncbi:hypothetical protein GLOTRDRAFT_131761 [Gloeophyllum trabeum ATCC 11539]|uniref:Uncharacterized protein n=1 Tax=Gloeophyllum trabeum (strain ATCC 11539 / FP-39264 / Madison 617) TaxID=670483 RepID=S7PY25_GLOTA|nr:uncharacterized protein GLOTRDRAFT_131761 [Gloeophyllum trabeum ATCC 11539]EPQ52521.1 hypothetical protein GLOTRDRAFT_131761 [Gloeophyllum trabeum ATCC 11539]